MHAVYQSEGNIQVLAHMQLCNDGTRLAAHMQLCNNCTSVKHTCRYVMMVIKFSCSANISLKQLLNINNNWQTMILSIFSSTTPCVIIVQVLSTHAGV